jgi:hypothetical protein
MFIDGCIRFRSLVRIAAACRASAWHGKVDPEAFEACDMQEM